MKKMTRDLRPYPLLDAMAALSGAVPSARLVTNGRRAMGWPAIGCLCGRSSSSSSSRMNPAAMKGD
jgi:hypothetical protein